MAATAAMKTAGSTLVIVAVVLAHTAVPYMHEPPKWWYVADRNVSGTILHSIFITIIDAVLMPILFFLAGFFTLPSLKRRGIATFCWGKLRHLGLVWLLGITLISPLCVHIWTYTHGEPISFIRMIFHDFWIDRFDQSAFWFLPILLAMQLLAATFYRVILLKKEYPEKYRQKNTGAILLGMNIILIVFFVIIALLSPELFGLTVAQAPDQHVVFLGFFVVQAPRLPLYIAFFLLGIYAWRANWLRPDGYLPNQWHWCVMNICAMVLYLGIRARLFDGDEISHTIALAISFTFLCTTALMSSLATFSRKLNLATPFWQSLTRNSYGIYFLHLAFVLPLALLLADIALNVWLKTFFVFSVSLGCSWLLSALVLTRAPLLRRIF